MSSLVTIVMPVYNTGTFLNSAITSILNQTYTNFELFLIDDGSTDNSPSICDNFAKQDRRVKTVHQQNGGICRARNTGLRMAKGDYITFCDHDDLYDKRILEQEVKLMKKYDADLAITGKRYIYDDGKEEDYGYEIRCECKESLHKQFLRILNNGLLDTVWNILYKKEVISNFRFDEKNKKGQEDLKFNLDVIDSTNSLIATEDILYFHFIRGALSTSARAHEDVVDAMLYNFKLKCSKIENFDISISENYNQYEDMVGETLLSIGSYMLKLGFNYKKYKEILKKIKFDDNIHGQKTKTKQRIAFSHKLFFFLISNKLYYISYIILMLKSLKERIIDE